MMAPQRKKPAFHTSGMQRFGTDGVAVYHQIVAGVLKRNCKVLGSL